ncbi:MAG: threonine--tRNA ligase [Actinomycetota bacterium]
MPRMKLTDGTQTELPEGEPVGSVLPPEAIAACVDGELRDLSFVPTSEGTVEVVLAPEEDGLHVLRHSTAHVMARAVCDLYPGAKYAIGPAIEAGFYYDFELPKPLSTDDLPAIEARMRELIAADEPFVREEISRSEAAGRLADQPYKIEILKGLEEAAAEVSGGDTVTFYRNGGWADLCLGPHVPSAGALRAFKLTSVAGAYWRGDEHLPQLTRIYGTAWATQADLDAHLARLEEIERRDHRKLGRELELFHLDPTAPGMPYWLPNGLRVMNALLAFWREEHERRGYQEISAPLVNDKTLWETSGHWDHFKDDMFVIPEDEHTTYALKPMNCPNAMVVFNVKPRSYRELPLRLSDCDTLHRNERSGTLHGLLRVRKFVQDDAHIFITPDQIEDEFERIFDLCDRFYEIFGLSYQPRLSTRPDDSIGDVETWNEAEAILRRILDRRFGVDQYAVEEGGGAFYGPKIDIDMSDAFDRPWQMGTIQLDFQLPRRFGCTYTDATGERLTPVVVHRVIYGSLERFIAILIEHTAGAFPLWLSPEQIRFVPVADRHIENCEQLAARAREAGLRPFVDDSKESVGKKIRAAQLAKAPYTLVVGDRDIEAGTFTVRDREGTEVPGLAFEDVIAALGEEARTRALEPTRFGG